MGLAADTISLLNGPVYQPPHVREAMAQQICDMRHPRFRTAYERSRERIRELTDAAGYSVVLASGSGTFGVELVLRNCLTTGDGVLALVQGTYGERMARMATLSGATVRELKADTGEVVTPAELEEELAREGARFVLMVHVEPSTATELDLAGLVAVCRRAGSIPIVDGICSGFALDVRLSELGIGAFVTASQKGLSLPPGMTVALVSPELAERARHTPVEKTGLYGHLSQWTGETFAFTPPLLHIFALDASLSHIAAETMAARAARHRYQAAQVQAFAQVNTLQLVPVASAAASTVTALYYPLGRDDAWLRDIRDRRGLELAPSNDARLAGRYFRIGHLGDLPQEWLERGLAILAEELEVNR
jgi:alanine-glyoxylate transaminase/serine-glyoxylate transaminase/serine-pyruvate transaminase